jgi:hypothetical protein
VVNATSADEDHAVGSVVGLDIGCKIITLDRDDVFLGAKNGTAEWLSCGGEFMSGAGRRDWVVATLPW